MKYKKYEKEVLCRNCGGINTITVDDIKMDNHGNFYIVCAGCSYLIILNDYEVPYSKIEQLKSDDAILEYQKQAKSISCLYYDNNYCKEVNKYGDVCSGRDCGYYTEKSDVI